MNLILLLSRHAEVYERKLTINLFFILFSFYFLPIFFLFLLFFCHRIPYFHYYFVSEVTDVVNQQISNLLCLFSESYPVHPRTYESHTYFGIKLKNTNYIEV